MNNIKELIGKFLFPGLLTIAGFFIIIYSSALAGRQNMLWLLGGVLIFTVGLFFILLLLDKLKSAVQKAMFFVFIPLAAITGYLSYKSIQNSIEFAQEKKARYADVIESLKRIRDIEIAYKAANGTYAGSFDTLISFLQTDSFTVIKAIGTVPDSISEQEAVDLGIVSRDTSHVSVFDSIVKGFDVMDIKIIPHSENVEFDLSAGMIERNQISVPVFEASAKNAFIFPGFELRDFDCDPEEVVKVGSMSDPSTSGNWE